MISISIYKNSKTQNSKLHEFEVHRPLSKGTKLLLQVIKIPINIYIYIYIYIDLTCKRGSVGQTKGLLIPRLSIRFRLKPKNINRMDLNYTDPQTRVLNYC